MDNYSLYLDHQAIAPLVRTLEKVVELTQHELQYQYETHEIRKPIYEEFVRILHRVYQENETTIKEEDTEVKQEEHLNIKQPKISAAALMNAISCGHPSSRKQTKQDQAQDKVAAEIQLVDWIIAQDKCIFEKKEIDDKIIEFGGSKRALPLRKTLELLRKYRLSQVILVSKNGQKHYVEKQELPNAQQGDLVKEEDFSLASRSEVVCNQEVDVTAQWQQISMQPIKEEGRGQEVGASQTFSQTNQVPDYVRNEVRVEIEGSIYDSEEESLVVGELNLKQ